MEKTYVDGLNDAWELAKKIHTMTSSNLVTIYGFSKPEYVLDKFAFTEALAKLKAYEEAQKIEVGDVVTAGNRTFIVTYISCDCVFGLLPDGDLYSVPKISDCKKTGKHIDIQSILERIGE